jgi:hypothetical protein
MRLRLRLLRLDWKYAIVELILIVLGISIATWANDWNEERLERKKEIQLLKDLSSDIGSSVRRWNEMILVEKKILNSIDIVLNCLSNENPYHHTLEWHFSRIKDFGAYPINKTTYESIKSEGIDILSNDSVKKKVIHFFDFSVNAINQYDEYVWSNQTTVILPIFNKRIRRISSDRSVPDDFLKLKEDKEFINTFSNHYFDLQDRLIWMEAFLSEGERLEEIVGQEISRLSK